MRIFLKDQVLTLINFVLFLLSACVLNHFDSDASKYCLAVVRLLAAWPRAIGLKRVRTVKQRRRVTLRSLVGKEGAFLTLTRIPSPVPLNHSVPTTSSLRCGLGLHHGLWEATLLALRSNGEGLCNRFLQEGGWPGSLFERPFLVDL